MIKMDTIFINSEKCCFIKFQYLLYMQKHKKISAPTWNDRFELPDG